MAEKLKVFLFPLDLASPYAGGAQEKPPAHDPEAEADILIAAAADNFTPRSSRPTTVTTDGTAAQASAVQDLLSGPRGAPAASSPAVPAAVLEAQADLASRLHYAAASYFSEMERGHILSRGTRAKLRRTPDASAATGRVDGGGGMRAYYVCPVEDGRYGVSVAVPPSVHGLFGPALVPLLLRTAVRGYDIASAVAANAAAPTYFPLHLRLCEDPGAVQRALQSRVAQVEAATRAALSATTGSGKLATLAHMQAMCRQLRPCPVRVPGALARYLHGAIHAAARPTHPAALHGSVASVGVEAGATKRFRVAAAAAWHRGEPLYCDDGPAAAQALEQQLRPAALAVMMDSLAAPSGGGAGMVRVHFKCIAMHAPAREWGGSGGGRSVGFSAPTVRPEEVAHNAPSALAVAFTNGAASHGWTVTVLLEATPTLFAGAPLPYVISGMQALLTTGLVSPVLRAVLPCRLFQGLGAGLAGSGFSAQVRGLRVVVRACLSPLGCVAPVAGDTCLWRYTAANADASDAALGGLGRRLSSMFGACSKSKTAPEKDSDDDAPTAGALFPLMDSRDDETDGNSHQIEALLALAVRLQSAQGQRARRRSKPSSSSRRPLSLSHTVFSVVYGESSTASSNGGMTVLHAVPTTGGIAYIHIELDSAALDRRATATLGRDALAFSTWVLSLSA